jgi:hypothetical protein
MLRIRLNSYEIGMPATGLQGVFSALPQHVILSPHIGMESSVCEKSDIRDTDHDAVLLRIMDMNGGTLMD